MRNLFLPSARELHWSASILLFHRNNKKLLIVPSGHSLPRADGQNTLRNNTLHFLECNHVEATQDIPSSGDSAGLSLRASPNGSYGRWLRFVSARE